MVDGKSQAIHKGRGGKLPNKHRDLELFLNIKKTKTSNYQCPKQSSRNTKINSERQDKILRKVHDFIDIVIIINQTILKSKPFIATILFIPDDLRVQLLLIRLPIIKILLISDDSLKPR